MREVDYNIIISTTEVTEVNNRMKERAWEEGGRESCVYPAPPSIIYYIHPPTTPSTQSLTNPGLGNDLRGTILGGH